MSAAPAGVTPFPRIGPSLPPLTIALASFVVGAVAGVVILGVSPWLIIALVLAVGAAALPRGPFAMILVVVLALALLLPPQSTFAAPVYSPRFVVLLAAAHLLLVLGSLGAWLPWRARVQLAVLGRPLARYLAVQVPAQLVAFAVLTLAAPGSAVVGSVWVALLGAVALVALAVVVLAPLLLRPAR